MNPTHCVQSLCLLFSLVQVCVCVFSIHILHLEFHCVCQQRLSGTQCVEWLFSIEMLSNACPFDKLDCARFSLETSLNSRCCRWRWQRLKYVPVYIKCDAFIVYNLRNAFAIAVSGEMFSILTNKKCKIFRIAKRALFYALENNALTSHNRFICNKTILCVVCFGRASIRRNSFFIPHC